ncbi:TRAP transporter substrate-binding protein [candidate division KSB1 bacterium]
MFKRISAAALQLIILFNISCGSHNNITIIKLGHSQDISHPVHLGMAYMAEILYKKSNGSISVDIYPSEQLGSERELIELLQIGSLGMAKVSASPLEGFVPEMKIFSLPYAFRNEEHLWKVLNGNIGKRLLLACTKYYLRGMCYYDAGSRSFYTKEIPIESPQNLNGLKIRVQKSITSVEMIKAMGGSATPIAWGELYTALQQGVVDGAENNPPSFYLSKHFEVCKFYSLDEHTWVPDVLLIGTKTWNRLSTQQQNWLQEAIDESVDYQRRLWKVASDEALREVQKAGVDVIYPEKSLFREAVTGMYDTFKGTHIYDLLQEINAIK